MSLSFVIIRGLLGVSFFILGVFLSRTLVTDFTFWDNPYLAPTLVALLSGVFGVFAVPFLADRVRKWFESLIRTTIAKTLADWTKQVSRQAAKTVESRRPKIKPAPSASAEVILDTSAIIDGRILDVARLHFVDGPFVVPQLVLDELQRLADSGDDLKRQRGRRGLAILEEMKAEKEIAVNIVETRQGRSPREDVDKVLVQVAKKRGARIATVDFNLAKIASVSGVKVLNVNTLAQSLRMIVLPGEPLTIRIVQQGKEAGQGVGYLEDGTMVVVEGGARLVGKEVTTTVSRSLQTEAGRMIFAVLNK